jgi:hypothetical protein
MVVQELPNLLAWVRFLQLVRNKGNLVLKNKYRGIVQWPSATVSKTVNGGSNPSTPAKPEKH